MSNCCIHLTNLELIEGNKLLATLSNGNTIITDEIEITNAVDSNEIEEGNIVQQGSNYILRFRKEDNSLIDVNVNVLKDIYLAGNMLTFTGNTINVNPAQTVGVGTTLLSTANTYRFKSLDSDLPINIVDNGETITLSLIEPEVVNIVNNNTNHNLNNGKSIVTINSGLTGVVLNLPNPALQRYDDEITIYAIGSGSNPTIQFNLLTSGTNTMINATSAPFLYSTTTNTLTLNMFNWYTIKKFNGNTYIIKRN